LILAAASTFLRASASRYQAVKTLRGFDARRAAAKQARPFLRDVASGSKTERGRV
jgi:hypothetical protein